MPIYEFKCESCSHIDEVLMKINDPAPANCSVCGGPLHKIMSMSSFSLKGSGWYATDYKNSGQKNSEEKAAATQEPTPQQTGPLEKSMPSQASSELSSSPSN